MSTLNTLPAEISDRLLPNEGVVWWGRPRQGLMLTPRDGLLIPFSFVWGGFSIFWEATVLMGNAPVPFALFGMVFVVIGLFLIVGRFFVDAWLRSRMVYALTDRRVLIARSGPWASFRALNRDAQPEVTLNERAGGRGTITFGNRVATFGYGNRMSGGWMPALEPTPQFLQIDDARRVFAAIQQR